MAEAEVHVYPRPSTDWQENWAWRVEKNLKEIESKLNLVIEHITTGSGGSGKASGNTPITDELAQAINRSGLISRFIDRKVPDQRPTPASTPKPPVKKPVKRKQARKPIKKRK